MLIERRLAVGMFLLGAMSHYDREEVVKYKDIQYIAATLHKKHFPIKNGTPEQRLWINPQHVIAQIKKTPKNKEKIVKRGESEFKKKLQREEYWKVHANIADTSWKKASDAFSSTNAITVNQLILALLRKEPKTAKWYGFNQKKLDKFSKTGEHAGTHIFSSSRVATKMLEHLDSEIAYYYAREKQC